MRYITEESNGRTKSTKRKLVVCLVLGVLLLAGAVWTVIVNPILLISRYCSRVDYGTFVHEAFSREVDSLHVSAYLFNITNADRFLSGDDAKLKVQEVGPFTYQENRTNEDFEIDKEAGVIRYTPRHRVTFLPEESIARPEDVMVTMPNMAMLAMGSLVNDFGFVARMGFNMLTSRLQSNATVQISAQDYLWGYNEPLIQLGNRFLPGWISFEKMGMLDRLYDENVKLRLEVSAREEDRFMIKTINGIGGLETWGYPEKSSPCNSFQGSFEGFGYPPEMTPRDRPLKIYRNVLCRIMEIEYQGQKTMDFGVEGMVYKFANRSYSKVPENECLCSKGVCYDGVSDLSPCSYGLPVVLSNAHFMGTNPLLYDRIEGIAPDEEQHGSEFTIEPIIGIVMTTKFSVQLNVLVRDVGFNAKISKFSHMFVPVAYFKIVQPRMQDEQIVTLRLIHIILPKILLVLQLILVIAGLVLLSTSARALYCNWIPSRKKGIVYKSKTVDVLDVFSNEPLVCLPSPKFTH